MARYACPSGSSTQSIVGPSKAGPSKTNKRTKPSNHAQPDAPQKRGTKYQHRGAKIKDASEAKKKDDKKKQLGQQVRPRIFAHVYIGNVEASTTEQELQDHFVACGKIRKTTMRVSRGQAVTGIAIPKAKSTSRDRKYATMEFCSPKSALDAIKLNGSMLKGVKLVVSAAAGDLPEVADIARPRIQNIRLKDQLAARPAPRVHAPQAPKPLIRNDTEADFSDPKNDKIKFFGHSFYKCII